MSKKLYKLIRFPMITHAHTHIHTCFYISMTSENTNGNYIVIFQAFCFLFHCTPKKKKKKRKKPHS